MFVCLCMLWKVYLQKVCFYIAFPSITYTDVVSPAWFEYFVFFPYSHTYTHVAKCVLTVCVFSTVLLHYTGNVCWCSYFWHIAPGWGSIVCVCVYMCTNILTHTYTNTQPSVRVFVSKNVWFWCEIFLTDACVSKDAHFLRK